VSVQTVTATDINNCTFESNTGSAGGSVLVLKNAGPVTISRSNFLNNNANSNPNSTTAIQAGGALVLHEFDGQGSFTDCYFYGNNAGAGFY
jgi:hypothetical protein